jgi:hypothetical protein
LRTAEWLVGISRKTVGVPTAHKSERDADIRDRSGGKVPSISTLVL